MLLTGPGAAFVDLFIVSVRRIVSSRSCLWKPFGVNQPEAAEEEQAVVVEV